jgi:hypothetical protein
MAEAAQSSPIAPLRRVDFLMKVFMLIELIIPPICGSKQVSAPKKYEQLS